MTGLILKLSYNEINSDVVGGICGSCFFVDRERILTAYHVLNKKEFVPNIGYLYCQFWVLIEPNIIIEIDKNQLFEYPEIDTVLVKMENENKINIKYRNISTENIEANELCFNEGFISGDMPNINANWTGNKLNISNFNYNNKDILGHGHIKSLAPLSINAPDVKLNNIKTFETSYGGRVGMSGGPLILKKSNEIIGLMSFGYPHTSMEKEFLYAIHIDEIISRIERN